MNIKSASHKRVKATRKHGDVYSYRADQIEAINAGDSIDNHEPAFYREGLEGEQEAHDMDELVGLDINGNVVH